ncbi:hypothetical protein [Brevundimonas aurantiaca]|nr:hypothetical protein [Brevundimonas aurantiaca]
MSRHGALDLEDGSETGAAVSGQSGQQSDMSIVVAVAGVIGGEGVACAVV